LIDALSYSFFLLFYFIGFFTFFILFLNLCFNSEFFILDVFGFSHKRPIHGLMSRTLTYYHISFVQECQYTSESQTNSNFALFLHRPFLIIDIDIGYFFFFIFILLNVAPLIKRYYRVLPLQISFASNHYSGTTSANHLDLLFGVKVVVSESEWTLVSKGHADNGRICV